MSEAEPSQTPLVELARSVPKDIRLEWEIQWSEDGTPTGYSVAPVGRYLHELAERIESLTAERDTLKAEAERLRQWYADSHRIIDEWDAKCSALRSRLATLKKWHQTNAVNLAVHRIGGYTVTEVGYTDSNGAEVTMPHVDSPLAFDVGPEQPDQFDMMGQGC